MMRFLLFSLLASEKRTALAEKKRIFGAEWAVFRVLVHLFYRGKCSPCSTEGVLVEFILQAIKRKYHKMIFAENFLFIDDEVSREVFRSRRFFSLTVARPQSNMKPSEGNEDINNQNSPRVFQQTHIEHHVG